MLGLMDRRNFLKISSALGAVSAPLASQAKVKKSVEPTKLTSSPPVLMAPTDSSISVVWRITRHSKSYVEYGPSADKLDQRADGDSWGMRPSGSDVLKIKLTKLNAGTRYYYRTVTETYDRKSPLVETSEVREFTTLSAASDSCHFTLWNDTHKNNGTIKALFEKTSSDSEFMLWNGDISNDWYQREDIPNSVLTPAGLDLKFPIIPLRGNHDLRGNHAGSFKDFVGSDNDLPWSAFRTGPVAVICLDTGEDKDDDNPYLFGRVSCHDMRVSQAKWLESVIQQPEFRDAPYRIVCCHIPLRWTDEKTDFGYDWFSKRSRILWHDSLVKWGAQAILSGHTHKPALLKASKEFPYAQLVGGGPKLDQATLITCKADAQQLVIHSESLKGETVHKLTLTPLS